MKIFILAILCGLTLAKPEGYFRQEYQFKKSSSTFQNNELQRKNEDEGFYLKQGDLYGKVVPKVDQHKEHMEYVNPQVDGVGVEHVVKTYNDRDLTHETESDFSKFHSGAYGSTYGSSSGSTYGMKLNLNQIFENVEYDLTSLLEKAITKFKQDSMYSKIDEIQLLEHGLKANLTKTLQNALHERYGNQGRQRTYTYTTSGAYSPNANYYKQELEDLKRKLEENLNKKLHEAIETTITHNIFQTSSSHGNFEGQVNSDILGEDCMQGDQPQEDGSNLDDDQRIIYEDDPILKNNKLINSPIMELENPDSFTTQKNLQDNINILSTRKPFNPIIILSLDKVKFKCDEEFGCGD